VEKRNISKEFLTKKHEIRPRKTNRKRELRDKEEKIHIHLKKWQRSGK
jgi:hypothetical protein